MQYLIIPRENAISAICGNLVMAGVLLPDEVADYMRYLNSCNNYQLTQLYLQSRINYQKALEFDAMIRRN